MAYGVKYRINYCNKENVSARLDIEIRDYVGVIEHVAGTTDVFKLEHQNENDNKTGYIISTFADINLYEHPITIDAIKTLDETAIRISYYIGGVLRWQGFALPDFFETEISKNAIVSISATDRLSALKDRTLTKDNISIAPNTPIITTIAECLKLTGLSLPIKSMSHFTISGGSVNTSALRTANINRQRLTDDKGREISAFDVLHSFLVAFNCYLVQRNNEWWIANKYELENGGGKLFSHDADGRMIGFEPIDFAPNIRDIDLISVGGRRAIQPSAFEVSLYGEYGGRQIEPFNYDFNSYGGGVFTGWALNRDATVLSRTKEVTGFDATGNPIFGTRDVDRMMQVNLPIIITGDVISTQNFISSRWVDIKDISTLEASIIADVILPNGSSLGFTAIIKDTSNNIWALHPSIEGWSKFADFGSTKAKSFYAEFKNEQFAEMDAMSGTFNFKLPTFSPTLFNDENITSLSGCQIQILITSRKGGDVGKGEFAFVRSAIIDIKSGAELPKGTIAKVKQLADFSKRYDTPTTIFSDYVTSGINGFFYSYPDTDTSILYRIDSSVAKPLGGVWKSGSSANDYLIMLSARQSSRLFSSARDVLTIEIDSNDFDILDIYKCGDKRFIATSLSFDFFRSKLSLTLEENVISNTTKRDFLYSYFGGSDSDNIKGIGGVTGGGGSGGGSGSSSPQYWQLDENGNLFTEYNAYSTKELSAYGLGEGSGGGGGGSLVSWGTEANSFIPLTVEGISKTVALQGHTHTKAQIGLDNVDNTSDLSKPISTATQTALNSKLETSIFNTHNNDNVRHITGAERTNWNEAYGWGNHSGLYTSRATKGGNVNSIRSLDTRDVNEIPNTDRANGMWLDFKLATTVGLTGAYVGLITILPYSDTTGNGFAGGRIALSNGNLYAQPARATSYGAWKRLAFTTDIDSALTNYVKKSGDTMTGNLTAPSFSTTNWKWEQVGTELQLKYNNVVAQRFLLDGSIVGLGEITAYGASTGGEGVSLLRTGGTMSGAIRWQAQGGKTPFIGQIDGNGTFLISTDGQSWDKGLTINPAGELLRWRSSDILTKASTANKIEMGNGWTIEQTTASLTIRRNGVIKGTFNA